MSNQTNKLPPPRSSSTNLSTRSMTQSLSRKRNLSQTDGVPNLPSNPPKKPRQLEGGAPLKRTSTIPQPASKVGETSRSSEKRRLKQTPLRQSQSLTLPPLPGSGEPFTPDLSQQIQQLMDEVKGHLERKDYKQADEVLRQIALFNPKGSWEISFVRGRFAMESGDVSSAVRLFQDALNQNPRNDDIRNSLTRAIAISNAVKRPKDSAEEQRPRPHGQTNQIFADRAGPPPPHILPPPTSEPSDRIPKSAGSTLVHVQDLPHPTFDAHPASSSAQFFPTPHLPPADSSSLPSKTGSISAKTINTSQPAGVSKRAVQISILSATASTSLVSTSSPLQITEGPPRLTATGATPVRNNLGATVGMASPQPIRTKTRLDQPNGTSTSAQINTSFQSTVSSSIEDGIISSTSAANSRPPIEALAKKISQPTSADMDVEIPSSTPAEPSSSLHPNAPSSDRNNSREAAPAPPVQPVDLPSLYGPSAVQSATPANKDTHSASANMNVDPLSSTMAGPSLNLRPNTSYSNRNKSQKVAPAPPAQPVDSPPPHGPSAAHSANLMKLLSSALGRFEKNLGKGLGETQHELRSNNNRLDAIIQGLEALRESAGSSNNLHDQPPTSGSGAGRPYRKKVKPAKIVKDPYSGETEHREFLKVIKKHIANECLKVHSYQPQEMAKLPPPLTEEEIKDYERGADNCITISRQNFRMDFSRSRDSPFNKEAISVAAADLIARITKEKWYQTPKIPTKYLVQDYVEFLIRNHVKYIRSRYQLFDRQESTQDRDKRLKAAARSSRKTRLFEARIDAVVGDIELDHHTDLLSTMNTQGVSSDESEPGLEGVNKCFVRISPEWRSEELQGFMWTLDTVIERNRKPKVGHRSVRGAEPRQRKFGTTKNPDAVAPPALPRNCYDKTWMESLTRKQCALLEVNDALYDFRLKKTRKTPSDRPGPYNPPGAATYTPPVPAAIGSAAGSMTTGSSSHRPSPNRTISTLQLPKTPHPIHTPAKRPLPRALSDRPGPHNPPGAATYTLPAGSMRTDTSSHTPSPNKTVPAPELPKASPSIHPPAKRPPPRPNPSPTPHLQSSHLQLPSTPTARTAHILSSGAGPISALSASGSRGGRALVDDASYEDFSAEISRIQSDDE